MFLKEFRFCCYYDLSVLFFFCCQLMEFFSDSNEVVVVDVLEFVREVIQRFDNLRMLIVEKMLEVFYVIKFVK